MHGVTFALMGGLLVFTFFDFNIALAAAGIAIYADGLACLIGKKWGKHKIYNGKSIEGSLTMFFGSLVIASIFLNNLWIILAMSLTSTLLELVVQLYPDDLVVPLYTGLSGQILAAILGLHPLSKGYSIGFLSWLAALIAILPLFFFKRPNTNPNNQ